MGYMDKNHSNLDYMPVRTRPLREVGDQADREPTDWNLEDDQEQESKKERFFDMDMVGELIEILVLALGFLSIGYIAGIVSMLMVLC